jgi:hypothetical protein
MLKKFLTVIIIIILNFPIYAQKIGISRLHYDNKNSDIEFYLNLEDKLNSIVIENNKSDFFALNIDAKYDDIKSLLNSWRESNDISVNEKIINELKTVDYCILYELINFEIKQEKDFYYPDKIWNIVNTDLKIALLDTKNKTIIDDYIASSEYKSVKSLEISKEESINMLIKKVKSYLEDMTLFKLKIFPEEIKALYIWLDKGSRDGLKTQNILVSYIENETEIKEESVVKIIKTEEDRSLAMILYANSPITKESIFTRISKINLELQIGGGFAMASKFNNVSARNNYFSFIPFTSLRLLLPVGISFFRPGFHFEFNFLYLDNRLLLPFTIETGCQGEIFIHRFEADLGFMVGALFSPNTNFNYELDSVVLRPYIHLSVLMITHLKLFGEFGYKFYVKNKLYNNWEIDLSGMYFSFGLGVNL